MDERRGTYKQEMRKLRRAEAAERTAHGWTREQQSEYHRAQLERIRIESNERAAAISNMTAASE